MRQTSNSAKMIPRSSVLFRIILLYQRRSVWNTQPATFISTTKALVKCLFIALIIVVIIFYFILQRMQQLYFYNMLSGAVVGEQPFGGARTSGTNDKAGSHLNLLRWVFKCKYETSTKLLIYVILPVTIINAWWRYHPEP